MASGPSFRYQFQLDELHDEHHDHMHGMLESWKKSYAKMIHDQKELRRTIDALEKENEEYRISNQRLERQVAAQQGAAPAPIHRHEPAGQGIVDVGKSKDHDYHLVTTIEEHSAPVHAVAMYKDSQMVATASWDQKSKLYNLNTGKVVRTLGGETNDPDSQMHGLYAVSFAKVQDDILGCTSCDKSVYLWDHVNGKMLKKLTGHTNEVNGIDFHSTQQVMCTASDDKTCNVWDYAEAIMLRTLDKHTQPVYGCVFLGQENQFLLATCSFDKSTRIFDMRDKSVVACCQMHTDDVIGIDYSSSKQILATGSDDGNIGIWDSRRWQLVMTINTKEHVSDDNEVKRVAFAPNGESLAAACSSGKVLVYDIGANGKEICQLGGHTDCVFDVAWGVDPYSNKKLLVSASHDHTCNYWKES